jgi:hypothetical protein
MLVFLASQAEVTTAVEQFSAKYKRKAFPLFAN